MPAVALVDCPVCLAGASQRHQIRGGRADVNRRSRRERHGFELGDVDGMVASDGTIYPLLSRLRREGLVDTTRRESRAGPPRRCYGLIDAGRRALVDLTDEWARFRAAVDLPPGRRTELVAEIGPFIAILGR